MIKYFRATKEDFKHCYDVRVNVFVNEQGWKIEEEMDDLDSSCIHYLAKKDDEYIATLRVHINNKDGHVGRVCVKKEYRNQHIGFNLMKFMEDDLKNELDSLSLGAQLHATKFYEKLGYVQYGDIYIEGIIEHINMKKIL